MTLRIGSAVAGVREGMSARRLHIGLTGSLRARSILETGAVRGLATVKGVRGHDRNQCSGQAYGLDELAHS